MRLFLLVASSRIELESGASETLILSIVLRGQKNLKMDRFENLIIAFSN